MPEEKAAGPEVKTAAVPEANVEPVETLGQTTGEQISNTDSKVNTIMTVGVDKQPEGHNLVETSAVIAPPPAPASIPSKDIVKVKIQYPEKYKGPRFFKDGDVKAVHHIVAEQFVNKLKIATLLEGDKNPV